MSQPFDLSRYFARIGYDGPAAPTLDVLRRLHLLHPQAIPFENLDPLTGARVALDVPAVVAKLVERRRGGYCFEQNKLFHAALSQIGFHVTPLIARVRWQRPADTATAQTHMLLRIDVDGEAWIADVGFGGVTLTAPLRSTPGVRQATPHGVFRLVETELPDEIVCEFETANGWQPVYRFSGKPVEWIDYDAANWFTSTFPASLFVHDLISLRVRRAEAAEARRDRAGGAHRDPVRAVASGLLRCGMQLHPARRGLRRIARIGRVDLRDQPVMKKFG